MNTTARMAPAWMATLNNSERSPSQCSAISRWPVLDTGRNSVIPSMMPRVMVCQRSDMNGPSECCDGGYVSAPASKVLGYAKKHTAAATELRRAHADAGTVTDLIDPVQQVDHVYARGQCARALSMEDVTGAHVELCVARQMIAIGN